MKPFMFILGLVLGVSVFVVTRSAEVRRAGAGVVSSPSLKPKKKGEIRVLVIDSGIASHSKLDRFVERETTYDYDDQYGHGTHVAGLIALGANQNDPLCKQVKIYSCRYYNVVSERASQERSDACFELANNSNVDYINYSGGGDNPQTFEHDQIAKFKGLVIVAAGNDHHSLMLDSYYPASYSLNASYNKLKVLNNIVVVQNLNPDGTFSSSTNRSPSAVSEIGMNIVSTLPGNKTGKMSGTSQAAAIHTHKVLQDRCRGIK